MIMKKALYAALVIVILMVIFYVSRKAYVHYKFKTDETYVKEVILQKDSEGRGFSDVVKSRIDDKFSDSEEARSQFYKYAKSARHVVESKSEREFIDASKAMLLKRRCVLYSLKDKADNSFVFDNKEMRDYYEYLDMYRFSSSDVESELTDWLNNSEVTIDNPDQYLKHCQ